MGIKVLYFAGLREALGTGEERITLSPEVATLADLRAFLAGRGENWQALNTMKNLRAAVNQSMAGPTQAVKDGDEVAFFPPVTGG